MSTSSKYRIEISPRPEYLSDESDPEGHHFSFSYTVVICNNGLLAAQLISRHWIITDGDNQVQEVKGLGVVGEQPFFAPGGRFEYTSGCVLTTPHGTMRGSYHMVGEDGEQFVADIPEFLLSIPRVLH